MLEVSAAVHDCMKRLSGTVKQIFLISALLMFPVRDTYMTCHSAHFWPATSKIARVLTKRQGLSLSFHRSSHKTALFWHIHWQHFSLLFLLISWFSVLLTQSVPFVLPSEASITGLQELLASSVDKCPGRAAAPGHSGAAPVISIGPEHRQGFMHDRWGRRECYDQGLAHQPELPRSCLRWANLQREKKRKLSVFQQS